MDFRKNRSDSQPKPTVTSIIPLFNYNDNTASNICKENIIDKFLQISPSPLLLH